MATKKEEKQKREFLKNEFDENLLELFCHNTYKFVGRKFLENQNFKIFFNTKIYNKKYEGILKKANLKLMPEEYFFSIFFLIVSVLVVVVFLTIVFLVFQSIYSLLVFFGGLGLISALGIFMYNYPIVLVKQRKDEIDAAMPYLLPYFKILSKELNLSKIIELIGDFLIYKEIKVEFKRIKYYSTVLGYDIQSSIRSAMVSCPSSQLSDLMNDLVTISNSGGKIYNYLERKLNNLEEEIEAIEKKNIDTLLIYSQIYVVLLLIAPLFYTIMSSILNLISLNSDTAAVGSGPNATVFSILALLFFLPLAYIGFMMLVYYSKPLYSRLKPIDEKNEL